MMTTLIETGYGCIDIDGDGDDKQNVLKNAEGGE